VIPEPERIKSKGRNFLEIGLICGAAETFCRSIRAHPEVKPAFGDGFTGGVLEFAGHIDVSDIIGRIEDEERAQHLGHVDVWAAA
jgi:hypothetical protein